MPKVADRYLEVDPWLVTEKGFHPDRSRVSESIFSVANESMGVRGYFEEGYGGDTHLGSYLNGVYESRKIDKSYRGISTSGNYMVNAVDWLHLRLSAGAEQLDLNASKFSEFSRSLDMRTGVMRRSFTWHTRAGGRIKLAFERFTSMVRPGLGCQSLSLESIDFKGKLALAWGLDFGTRHEASGMANFWECRRQEASGSSAAALGRTLSTGCAVFAGFLLEGDLPPGRQGTKDGKLSGCSMLLELAPGQSKSINRRAVVLARMEEAGSEESAWKAGQQALRKAGEASYESAREEQGRYWAGQWEKLDFKIEGDPENQQGMRYSIFQLHQTYHGADPRANIGAKGLTGEFYNGHTFWDTEAYCLSFYLFNNPAAAKNLLLYRYNKLPQAMERARQIDCEGACFPFATIHGEEDCGLWWIANTEIHVSLAVFYGVWNYSHISGDSGFLYNEGIELLVQISRFYASRGQWSQRKGDFGIYGVMGPDEFKLMVNNNAYINIMSKKCFQYTAAVLKEMEKKAPARLKELKSKVGLKSGEAARWLKKAKAMRIPRDPRTGVFEQNDGFFDMPHIDLKKIPAEQFPLYHSWSYDRLYRYDMHKQPDVLLFMFFFSKDFDLRTKKANYDYYEPRCIHESSLSPAIHSILAAELGYAKQSYGLAQYASRLDLDNYNRNTREGLHTTSLSAAWMNLVYGFGGMRSDGPCLSFNPTLPAKWKGYSFRLIYRDSVLELKVRRGSAVLSLVSGPEVKAELMGRTVKVTASGAVAALPGASKPNPRRATARRILKGKAVLAA